MAGKILVCGGAGYVGSVLVPKLVQKGYSVRVFDTFWFWKSPSEYAKAVGLEGNGNLEMAAGDLRNMQEVENAVLGIETVIQLACISNDPSSDLDEKFTHSVNYDGNVNAIDAAKKAGVKKFIYASSSSVYGVKKEHDVTEEVKLEPLTQYSKLKVEIEHYLLHCLEGDFRGVILRPATVCGHSPRQRLDVVVNILANFAINKGRMRIFGGEQLRPNIHIQDMADAYVLMVETDAERINGGVYNVGWDNLTIYQIGDLVKEVVGNVSVETEPTNDPRSYHISSEKIRKELGFVPKRTVRDAIADLKKAFEEGKLPVPDDERYYNVKTVKRILEEVK